MSPLRLPDGSSDLTAAPWEDFDADERWVEVAQLDIGSAPAAFWHCMSTWTNSRHFNRNIWRIDLVEEGWCQAEGRTAEGATRPLTDNKCPPDVLGEASEANPSGSESPNAQDAELRNTDCDSCCEDQDALPVGQESTPERPRVRGDDAPPANMRWIGLRELQRKTPAPVGGGDDGFGESHSVLEWTAQYISPSTGLHTAVFGLVIPETARKNGNHRALQFWPFQYPKTRALSISYEPLDVAEDSVDAVGQAPSSIDGIESRNRGRLRYRVLPLEPDENCDGRDYSAIKKYAENAALKLLHTVRKYCDKFDPVEGVSTYVKRVVHDRFVDEEAYRSIFRRLKKRYGLHWCKVWHEHAETDPVKFVYEEMSIAAYLIALFERERPEKKQTFVDLGCGNGFLTYLLLEEGYTGTGIDIFSRDLWDAYPAHVRERLKAEKLDPETYVVPDDVDWIIGNHSDELTPWIPAIAARSQRGHGGITLNASPKFFVLPCCFFDMDGRKYAQHFRRSFYVKDQGQGRYEMYITYVERLSRGFGFAVERENMRIPSTKYIAILGQSIEFPERVSEQAVASTCRLAMDDARLSHRKT